jgi:hypothetical protein
MLYSKVLPSSHDQTKIPLCGRFNQHLNVIENAESQLRDEDSKVLETAAATDIGYTS